MRKKLLSIVVAILLISVIFTGCGGGSNNTQVQKPTTANLTVTVSEDSGSPLENATVTVGNNKGTTDASGKVVFEKLEPGDYTVKAEKDGHESAEQSITLKAGDETTVHLSLKKVAVEKPEELKNLSKLKSYRVVMEGTSDEGKVEKMVLVQDNFGKSQHVIAYDENGKVDLELYIVGDKAKIKSNGKWMEVPAATMGMMTQSTLGFVENLTNQAIEAFNDTIVGKDVHYKVTKEGRETVNGYPTVKYHISAKGGSEGESIVFQGDIWVISSGQYKDYTTRMVMTTETQDGKKSTFTINITDFGKDMHISLP